MFAFAPSSFLGLPPAHVTPSLSLTASTTTKPRFTMSSKVLIVNTKGAGHGFIGLHLARELLQQGHAVDLVQVGGTPTFGPFAQYPPLATQFSNFTYTFRDAPVAPAPPYDAVYDNNAKSAADIATAVAAGRAGAEVFYVASAGAYTYDPALAPHVVGDPAAGPTVDVEQFLVEQGVSAACFRPIYIVGDHSSKREYLDYFFDRIVRGRPLPLPGTGCELTSLTDVRDVATMLAAALGRGLRNETFNAVNTRGVTFDGLVQMCEDACGRKAQVVRYDPTKVKEKMPAFVPKKAFPFRPRHFFADPGEATAKLGWTAEVSGTEDKLASTIKASYDDYIQLGLDKRSVDFSLDDDILKCV